MGGQRARPGAGEGQLAGQARLALLSAPAAERPPLRAAGSRQGDCANQGLKAPGP